MAQPAYPLPVPHPQPETDFYWEKVRAHELWLMRCNDCQGIYFYPRTICPLCFSRNLHWVQSLGRGVVYAFSVVYRAPTTALIDAVPYVAVLVELEEGVRLPSLLVEVEPDPSRLSIGMQVEVVFDPVTAEITLPKFRPRR